MTTTPSSSSRRPTSSTCGSKYGSPTGHSPSARTGARYGHGAGISSTGSSPIAMIRSALASSGASIVAPVRRPAACSQRSGTRPFARYVVSTGHGAPARRLLSSDLTPSAPTPSANTGRLLEASRRAAAGRSPRGGSGGVAGIDGRGASGTKATCTGPRGGSGGDADRRVNGLLRTVGADRDAPLGHRREQRILVEPLVRDPGAVRERDRIADQQHRLSIEHRLCHAVDGARDTRPARHDARARRTRQLAVDARHDRRGALSVGEDEAQPARARRRRRPRGCCRRPGTP